MRNYQSEAEEALKKGGGFYTFEDILEHLSDGRMQSFISGDSLVVTRIDEFPRRKVLEVILAVGNLEEIVHIEYDVLKFALSHGCSAMMASGRDGWYGRRTNGWERAGSWYLREL